MGFRELLAFAIVFLVAGSFLIGGLELIDLINGRPANWQVIAGSITTIVLCLIVIINRNRT